MIYSISKQNIIKNILLLFSANATNQAAIAVSVLLTARPLGIEAFGQYSACFALTKMTSIFFNLGMDTWLLREGRRGETTLGQLVTSNLSVKLIAGLFWLAGMAIISLIIDPQTYPQHLLFLCALATWVEAVLLTITHSFNISLKNHITVVLTVMFSSFLLGSTIYLYSKQHNNPGTYVFYRLFGTTLTLLVGIIWFRKRNKLITSWQKIRIMLKKIPPFALSDFLVLIYTQADITIIALLLGKQAAGAYSPASSILRSIFIIPSAVFMVMTPVISQLVIQKDQLFPKAIRQTNIVLAAVGAILWLGTSLFGPIFASLVLGREYAISGEVLTILGPILFLKSCSYASASVIIATDKQVQRVVVQGIVATINLTLNLLIIQSFGIIGVAWVYIISEALLLLGYMIIADQSRKKIMQDFIILPMSK